MKAFFQDQFHTAALFLLIGAVAVVTKIKRNLPPKP